MAPRTKILRNKYQRGYGSRRRRGIYQRGHGKFGDFLRAAGRKVGQFLKSERGRKTLGGVVRNLPHLMESKDKRGTLKQMGKHAIKDALQLGDGRRRRRVINKR